MAKETKVNIKLKGEMEVPSLDVQQYIGKKERISSVETMKGDFGYYVKVSSTVLDILKFKDVEKPLVATKIFSLFTDEEGNTGWGTKSMLAEYLALKKVKTPEALVGKEIVIQTSIKNGKEFLTFI